MAKGIEIKGAQALQRMLRELPKAPARKVNRAAVTKATTPLLNACKDACPVDHDDLRRSLIKKITNEGMRANGIVGADENYVASAGTGERLKLSGSKEEKAAIVAAAADAGGGDQTGKV